MEMRNSYSRIPGLLDSRPLLVMPELAVALGLNEAIFVQQLHYWMKKSEHYIDGHRWVYNTLKEWQKQFPWWSTATIGRVINGLENKGILLSENYNEHSYNQTKWYTIDFEALDKYVSPEKKETTEEKKKAKMPDSFVEEDLKEKEAARKVMKKNGIFMSRLSRNQLDRWLTLFSSEMIEKSVEMALYYGSSKWTYVNAILEHWHKSGIKTIEEVDRHEKERKKNKGTSRQSAKVELVPDWFKRQKSEKEKSNDDITSDIDIEKERKKLIEELRGGEE